MNERNARILQCAWPDCHNTIWHERGLEICGGHARRVLDALPREVEERAAAHHERHQDGELLRLRSEVEMLKRIITWHEKSDAAKKDTRKATAEGTVYYVQVGAHIKIGWTTNLEKRMRSYPPNSQMLAAHPGTRADENKMHRRFATDRTHGREWYVPSVSLLHHIDSVKAKHGQPESITFGAAPVTIPQPRGRQHIGGNNRGNWQRGVSPTGLAS